MLDFLNGIYQGLVNFSWEGLYEVIRIIIIALDVIFFGIFIFALKKALEYRLDLVGSFRRKEENAVNIAPKFDMKKYARHWEEIQKKAPLNPPESFTLAIVAADNLVGDALREMGLEGEHIAERLEKLNPREIKTLNNLWRAHRVRNDLVHTTGFEIKKNEAMELLLVYESFLKEIGALK